MSSDNFETQAPAWSRALGELGAFSEAVQGAFASYQHRDGGIRGDGHPILVIPGLGATDFQMDPLHRVIENSGYKPYGWGLGLNKAFTLETEQRLVGRLREISRENEGRKVSVIGWSLGGLYARAMALEEPEIVRQVITLGTPYKGIEDTTPVWLFEKAFGIPFHETFDEEERLRLRVLTERIPVPYTSVFSKTDGIVNWRSCQIDFCPDARQQSIEVRGLHMALPANPQVYEAVERLLEVPENEWRPAPMAITAEGTTVTEKGGVRLHYMTTDDGLAKLSRHPEHGYAVENPDGTGRYSWQGSWLTEEQAISMRAQPTGPTA